MRALKWIGIGIGSLLVLLIVGLLLAAMFIDPNAFRGRLQVLVHERTGRELQLQGDLKVSVFPWLAVEFGPATFGNAAGFGREPMLVIRHARLGLKFWPLLHGQFEIGSVRLDGPAVRLEVDPQGKDNWSDLLADKKAPEPAAAPTRLRGSVASLALSDGSLVYVDHRAGTTRKVSGLQLRTGRIEPGESFHLDVQATAEPDAQSRIDLKFGAEARLQPDVQRYEFAALARSATSRPASVVSSSLPCRPSSATASALAASMPARLRCCSTLGSRVAGASMPSWPSSARGATSARRTGPLRRGASRMCSPSRSPLSRAPAASSCRPGASSVCAPRSTARRLNCSATGRPSLGQPAPCSRSASAGAANS